MHDTTLLRCGHAGNSFRYFNRSMTTACLERLAQSRTQAYHKPSQSYRLLMMGVSNMRLVWHAMTADDVYPDALTADRACSESVLPSFKPHVIEYTPWLVVANTSHIYHKSHAVCIEKHALGGGADAVIYWTERAKEPFDAVAINAGAWDASFTSRNEVGYEEQLEVAVQHLERLWPAVRVLLFTPSPCGPLTFYPQRNGKVSPSKRATPAAGCAFVPNMTRAVWRVAARHPLSVNVIDQWQMVESHPLGRKAGPPGIWQLQRAGWHPSSHTSRRQRAQHRTDPPSNAMGEIPRALANRIYNVLCS